MLRCHVFAESVSSHYTGKKTSFLTDISRFHNGGLFFSSALLTAIACISLYSFLLLVQTRNIIPVSFGDIGGILFGRYMRFGVLTAITFSQVSNKVLWVFQDIDRITSFSFLCV